jgi:hypothetical protein
MTARSPDALAYQEGLSEIGVGVWCLAVRDLEAGEAVPTAGIRFMTSPYCHTRPTRTSSACTSETDASRATGVRFIG